MKNTILKNAYHYELVWGGTNQYIYSGLMIRIVDKNKTTLRRYHYSMDTKGWYRT